MAATLFTTPPYHGSHQKSDVREHDEKTVALPAHPQPSLVGTGAASGGRRRHPRGHRRPALRL
ncbi:hypothetical protein AERO8C_30292 [Aeromonas veronii]|uniref:Uncharacterized protein n=1 Tax=Aeromonas veronii TaxID=654 RepID=A0A653L6V6_AERVE|nr:hypothetical protein AERO8C_30292 [Aeromonas veronii]